MANRKSDRYTWKKGDLINKGRRKQSKKEQKTRKRLGL